MWMSSVGRYAGALGATQVPADWTNVGTKFNNGSVDGMFATVNMIAQLELNRGLSPEGAILRCRCIRAAIN